MAAAQGHAGTNRAGEGALGALCGERRGKAVFARYLSSCKPLASTLTTGVLEVCQQAGV
jgi:hypothetical protein